jgi:hypothetical protein
MKKAPILTLMLFAVAAVVWVSIPATRAQPQTADKPSAESGQPKVALLVTDIGQVARSPAPAATAGMSAADLLRQARERLHAYHSVKARIIETVVIGDRKFQVTGTYLQGRNFKLKLALDVRLGEQGEFQGSMLQVCDGQVLWTSHVFGKSGRPEDSRRQPERSHRITRRDIRQIIGEAARHNELPQNRLVAELGLGGISELLASLERTMVFGRVRQDRIDRKQFIVVQGRWNAEVLKNFLDSEELKKARSAAGAKQLPVLPEHVPDVVRIYFEQDNLFPRRILYLKRPLSHDSLRPMLSLNFVKVQLNAPVDDNEFNFVPPDKVFPQDVTNSYLQQIEPAKK